jgi:hypothetical protein
MAVWSLQTVEGAWIHHLAVSQLGLSGAINFQFV